MNMLVGIQTICAILALFLGPMILAMLVRCIVHDRGYSVGKLDMILASSIVGMFLLGLPTL